MNDLDSAGQNTYQQLFCPFRTRAKQKYSSSYTRYVLTDSSALWRLLCMPLPLRTPQPFSPCGEDGFRIPWVVRECAAKTFEGLLIVPLLQVQ